MSHELLRLTGELYDVPHLVSLDGFNRIINYLELRNTGLASMPTHKQEPVKKEFYDAKSKVATISLMGTTTYRHSEINALCGITSYEGILAQTQEAIDAGVNKIVLHIDSGGGSAQGCFASANEFRQMCDAAGVTVYGFVDGSCCSAALAWGVVCDVLVADQYSNIGSLGVLIALKDTSEADAKEGVKTIYITDGASKVPFDENGKYKSEFLKELQDKVTYLGDEFRKHVSMYTGIPVDKLKDTQAKVYMASDAMNIGFINKIMTKTEFVSYVMNGEM